MKKYVILASGGSGTRMNAGKNKIFLDVAGRMILKRSILLFEGLIDGMVIVCRKEDRTAVEKVSEALQTSFFITIASGGDTRQQSVHNGLKMLQAESGDMVLVHDAARCLTPREVIFDVIDSCSRFGSGIPGIPSVNTMKYADADGFVTGTINRSGLYEIQTPQAFRYGALLEAYMHAEKNGYQATDDASVMEYYGAPVHMVHGSKKNLKATEKEDLPIMNAIASQELSLYRIGSGYDVHRLTENRKLIICGVEIPYPLGLLGHSDADVGLHALMDALLGAASLGDIGKHFPDTSDQYENISSLLLLRETMRKVREAGYELVNADLTIVAQKPRLSPYIQDMIRITSDTVGCNPDQISIKATTTERLGFEGREEGISASSVCMLRRTV